MSEKISENQFKSNYIYLLDANVLVVAVANKGKPSEVKEWSAYIGVIEKDNQDAEWKRIANHGTKIPKGVAEALFPDLSKLYRWR